MSKSFLALFLFVAAVFAQNAVIGLPTLNQTVSAGTNLTVQVQRPDTLSSSEEVAVVIGIQSCPSGNCFPPSEVMGTILYNGPFNPEFHEPYLPPYENFTVQIPSTISQGTAQIGVAHATLVGASLYPWLETLNQTVIIG